MRISLDTNAYTEFFRGNERARDVVRRAEGVSISAVVVGELIFGFRHGARYAENRRLLDSFLAEPLVSFVPVTLATCERFGMIAEDLRRAGRPIPQNDIWIAAHALETGTDLLTFDRHFEAVSGLVLTLLEA
jgi:predicted nucleic acid-binding protein